MGRNGERLRETPRPARYTLGTFSRLGEDVCRKKAGDILRAVRASQKAPGCERIYTAGEKEHEIRLAR